MDEFPEFSKQGIEMMRQPLESRKVVLSRVSGRYEFPADFMLVAAMNPCRCGYYPDRSRCHCTQQQVQSYLGKISKPILDRIDICVEAAPISFDELKGMVPQESSARIRERVERARGVQRERFLGSGLTFNSEMKGDEIQRYCGLEKRTSSSFGRFTGI